MTHGEQWASKNFYWTGLDRARKEGREKGSAESKRATAKHLRELGVSLEIIMKGTGLTEKAEQKPGRSSNLFCSKCL